MATVYFVSLQEILPGFLTPTAQVALCAMSVSRGREENIIAGTVAK